MNLLRVSLLRNSAMVLIGLLTVVTPHFLFIRPASAATVRVLLREVECMKQNEGGDGDEIYIAQDMARISNVYRFFAGDVKTLNIPIATLDDRRRFASGMELMESDSGLRGRNDLLGFLTIKTTGDGRIVFQTHSNGRVRNGVMNRRNQTYTAEFVGSDAIYRLTFHYFWD